jgi:hypothetical protein
MAEEIKQPCLNGCEFYKDCKYRQEACAELAYFEGAIDTYIPAPRWPNKTYYTLIMSGRTESVDLSKPEKRQQKPRFSMKQLFEDHKNDIITDVVNGDDYTTIGNRYGITPKTLGGHIRRELNERYPDVYPLVKKRGKITESVKELLMEIVSKDQPSITGEGHGQ